MRISVFACASAAGDAATAATAASASSERRDARNVEASGMEALRTARAGPRAAGEWARSLGDRFAFDRLKAVRVPREAATELHLEPQLHVDVGRRTRRGGLADGDAERVGAVDGAAGDVVARIEVAEREPQRERRVERPQPVRV